MTRKSAAKAVQAKESAPSGAIASGTVQRRARKTHAQVHDEGYDAGVRHCIEALLTDAMTVSILQRSLRPVRYLSRSQLNPAGRDCLPSRTGTTGLRRMPPNAVADAGLKYRSFVFRSNGNERVGLFDWTVYRNGVTPPSRIKTNIGATNFTLDLEFFGTTKDSFLTQTNTPR